MDLRVLRYFLTVAKEQSYPMVQIALHTGTADTIFEMMNKGLVDIGLFMEPVNTEGLAYIRLPESDCWVVGMRPDDPLAQKEVITKEDLFGLPLICRSASACRASLQTGLEKIWRSFGLHLRATSGRTRA